MCAGLIENDWKKQSLFEQRRITGLVNEDITPEFAVVLGTAYGTTLDVGSSVTISRDQREVSRMIARALIAGLMSTGINIQNFEATAIPITRTIIPRLEVQGGIHVRIHPWKPDHIWIDFFSSKGLNISQEQEDKIEKVFFNRETRKVKAKSIGSIDYANRQAIDIYTSKFEKNLKKIANSQKNCKIVLDYVHAVSGAILPVLLNKLGYETVVLNTSLNQSHPTPEELDNLLVELGDVVGAVRASFGVQMLANGEQLILIDETGIPIRGEILTALLAELFLANNPGRTIVVPVHSSSAIEQIAQKYEGIVIRTKNDLLALMEACSSYPNVLFGGSSEVGYIFPEMQVGFDSMFCVAKLSELLTSQQRSLKQVRSDLPHTYYRTHTILCPLELQKGLIDRLIESRPADNIDLLDGVKIFNERGDGWILFLPDKCEPSLKVFSSSSNRSWADRAIKKYRNFIEDFIKSR